VILAAGAGRRFGQARNKLLTVVRGKPLVQHAIDAAAASHAMGCTVVTGANSTDILACVELRRCCAIENALWQEGIAASIRTGLACHRDDDACIFLVGDQPFVQSTDIDRLIAAFMHDRNAIVALQAAKVWGTPVLFPRRDFAALSRLRGDEGAKRYAARQEKRLRFVTAVSKDAFADVDSRADAKTMNV